MASLVIRASPSFAALHTDTRFVAAVVVVACRQFRAICIQLERKYFHRNSINQINNLPLLSPSLSFLFCIPHTQTRTPKELKCFRKHSCAITVDTRRFCQRCRLDKCIAVGMKMVRRWHTHTHSSLVLVHSIYRGITSNCTISPCHGISLINHHYGSTIPETIGANKEAQARE